MGDGQATQNDFIVKPNVRKVRLAVQYTGKYGSVCVTMCAVSWVQHRARFDMLVVLVVCGRWCAVALLALAWTICR
jgi:hypothetical protein